jgi:hypothetical protein
LAAHQINDFVNFWERLEPINLAELIDDNNFSLGLKRFNSSYNRATKEDKFIDLAISYETLFSRTSDGTDSTTHKLALRYANLVSKEFAERIQYFRKMKKLYQERSNIVHGQSKRNVHSETMEQNIRKAIIAYLSYYEINLLTRLYYR